MLYSGGGAGASRQSAPASISTPTPKTKTPAELIAEIDEKIRVKEADMEAKLREAKNYSAENNKKAAITKFRYVKLLENEVISLKASRANLTRMQQSLQSATKTANDVAKLRTMVASHASRKREGGKKMRRSRKQNITKRKTRKGAYIRSLLYSGGGAGASTPRSATRSAPSGYASRDQRNWDHSGTREHSRPVTPTLTPI